MRVLRQQTGMTLRDMKHDGAGFEQPEAPRLIGRRLAEGLEDAMGRLFLVALREIADAVILSGLF